MSSKSRRRYAIGVGIVAAVAVLPPAAGQNMPKRKPGLWESQMMSSGPEAEQMKQKMAQMTPQQRAQMEEMTKRNGFGFTPEGAMLMRYCVTPDESEMNAKTLLGKTDPDKSNCEQKEFNRSGNEIRFHTVCTTPRGVSDWNGRVYDITPTSMAMEMTAKTPREGEKRMTQKARWISDSCGNLK